MIIAHKHGKRSAVSYQLWVINSLYWKDELVFKENLKSYVGV